MRSASIHRDFKPANVILETGSSGTKPVITDFGLARSDGHERHDLRRRHAHGGNRRHPGLHGARAVPLAAPHQSGRHLRVRRRAARDGDGRAAGPAGCRRKRNCRRAGLRCSSAAWRRIRDDRYATCRRRDRRSRASVAPASVPPLGDDGVARSSACCRRRVRRGAWTRRPDRRYRSMSPYCRSAWRDRRGGCGHCRRRTGHHLDRLRQDGGHAPRFRRRPGQRGAAPARQDAPGRGQPVRGQPGGGRQAAPGWDQRRTRPRSHRRGFAKVPRPDDRGVPVRRGLPALRLRHLARRRVVRYRAATRHQGSPRVGRHHERRGLRRV